MDGVLPQANTHKVHLLLLWMQKKLIKENAGVVQSDVLGWNDS